MKKTMLVLRIQNGVPWKVVQGLKVYIHSCNTSEWTTIQNVWYTLCDIPLGTEHSSEIAYANIVYVHR